MRQSVADDEEPQSPPMRKRMKKREVERLRKQQQRMWIVVAAVAAASVVVAAVVITAPPPAPPHDMLPGEIVSQNPMHIHPKLTILSNGESRALPGNIGLNGGIWASHTLDVYLDPREGAQGQLSPVHTHDSSGVIHVEARLTRGFTLGEFFEVWGQPLGPQRTWDMEASGGYILTLTVDGQPSSAWQNVVFHDNQNIVISYRPA